MKQLQFTFQDKNALDSELRKIRQWYRTNLVSSLLIQIYTEILDRELIEDTFRRIRTQLPDAIIVGCSSNGNILNGDFSGGSFSVVCTLFEYPSTKVKVLQYPMTSDTVQEDVERLRAEIDRNPWVKGVELLVTIRGMSMTGLCEGLSTLPENIQIFGGGAFSGNLEVNDACVFSNVGGYTENGIIFILFGGEELYLETTFLTGWKPLGMYLNVTAADGEYLRELNGQSAYEVYYKYLSIKNDENFFLNTLEFPLFYHYNGIDIMRAPTASNPDGSLTMTADISQGVKARIAYGDPGTILDSAWQEGNRLLDFCPESITVFSCAARRTFWGNAEVGRETEPYQIVAPTSGFYTSGEFVRTNGFVNQHNVTQVIAAMREGEAKPHPEPIIRMSERVFEGKVSIINRMATYIMATSEELTAANSKLAEANRQLEEVNRRLSSMAITDALTGLRNKAAYFDKTRELNETILAGNGDFSAAVFDMNGLKKTNDTYGHEYGDLAILDTVRVLLSVFGKEHLYRIGGDEFIAIMDRTSAEEMERLFRDLESALTEENRTEKAYKSPLSLSKGYSTFIPGEDTDYKEIFRRADEAMYQDKTAYYRTHEKR